MADTTEQTYYGLTLSQHRERIKKLATERGLSGDVLERVVARAVDLIPTIRVTEPAQR
ncbi:hypothetical protein Q8W71_09865 [Methylobacterium sp. NEAU 140]|uniref:hypothetical protein n=1 Tax=Methylobacterium sp. NEAU 140 TaxID=3064945 RepID=UPI0027375421|nr:hypothetical protein [Methylobacterium sp. NEAU 140]MDP4022928.1 hypothetical protein [Methylobacterium sp. NEAU 140]